MKPIEIKSDDSILKEVEFKVYRYKDKRVATQFMPESDEPQTQELRVPWGDTLTMKRGDYLVSDADNPEDSWPVERDIFEKSHEEEAPGTGIFRKVALVYLVPLTDFTDGDPDQLVSVHSLEGVETVRAGDFHLARGIKGEIWAFPSEKVAANLDEVNY